MARVLVDGAKLVVIMGNLERILTWKGRFEAPLGSVTGIDTGRAQTSFVGSFVSGGGFGAGAGFKTPFLPFGGRFTTRDGRTLVAFRDPAKCITISLKGTSYDRIVVQVRDKEAAAEAIRGTLNSRPAPGDSGPSQMGA